MSPEQLAEAKRYGRWELACSLADKLLDLAFLAAVAVLAAEALDRWLQGWAWPARSQSLRLVLFFLLMTAAHTLVSLPLAFFSGHVLEHRFGLSTLKWSGWLWRYAKRNLLAVALAAPLVLGLYWLIWTTGPWWWLVGAGAFFLVSAVLGQLAPVVILPLFYKIERLDSPELRQRMAGLTAGTGLSVEGVYRLALSNETVKANAMLAGLGRTRRVLMGDTLLERFTPDEIEVIFAHEIGHHVFRHIRKLMLAGAVLSAAGFWICDRLLARWAGAGPAGLHYAALPVATLPKIMLILATLAMLSEPLQNAVSRRMERQCDRYALRRTGRRAAYRSAFRKLAEINKDDPSPHWLDVLLFHSHPPIAQRLALADDDSGGPKR